MTGSDAVRHRPRSRGRRRRRDPRARALTAAECEHDKTGQTAAVPVPELSGALTGTIDSTDSEIVSINGSAASATFRIDLLQSDGRVTDSALQMRFANGIALRGNADGSRHVRLLRHLRASGRPGRLGARRLGRRGLDRHRARSRRRPRQQPPDRRRYAFIRSTRRGGRAVECGGLENRYASLGVSRVQIPPSPLLEPEPACEGGFRRWRCPPSVGRRELPDVEAAHSGYGLLAQLRQALELARREPPGEQLPHGRVMDHLRSAERLEPSPRQGSQRTAARNPANFVTRDTRNRR